MTDGPYFLMRDIDGEDYVKFSDVSSYVNALRRAIDECLFIIAGGNPDLPADVLAEVELRLQEAYVNHSRNVPDK